MIAYILRRLVLGIPTIIGTLLLLFVIFYQISDPDQMARSAQGEKATPESILNWKQKRGYSIEESELKILAEEALGKEANEKELLAWKLKNGDMPSYYNTRKEGLQKLTETTFYTFTRKMVTFDFGLSDYDSEAIWVKLRNGVIPSLFITAPIFFCGLFLSVFLSMLVAMFRGTYIDKIVVFGCITGMSIVYFLYIIGLQFVMAKTLKWFPISGWSDNHMVYFLILPWIIGTLATVWESIRFYRTIMIQEINSDYIRTARAKGLGDLPILYKHLLRNAMIPILTRVIMALPYLVTGSLLLESFFGIPGLGRMTVEAINFNDLPTLSAVAYLSSIIFILANIVSDISYTFVDPRVRLK